MGHSTPNANTHDSVGAEYQKTGYAGGADQQPAVWTTNSTSPEAKIPPGQFRPGNFAAKKLPTHHTDPTAPGNPLV